MRSCFIISGVQGSQPMVCGPLPGCGLLATGPQDIPINARVFRPICACAQGQQQRWLMPACMHKWGCQHAQVAQPIYACAHASRSSSQCLRPCANGPLVLCELCSLFAHLCNAIRAGGQRLRAYVHGAASTMQVTRPVWACVQGQQRQQHKSGHQPHVGCVAHPHMHVALAEEAASTCTHTQTGLLELCRCTWPCSHAHAHKFSSCSLSFQATSMKRLVSSALLYNPSSSLCWTMVYCTCPSEQDIPQDLITPCWPFHI